MAPRPRKPRNKGLEPNLYPTRNSYQYKNPLTGESFGMGTDRVKANRAAKIINQKLMREPDLVNRVLGAITVGAVIQRFREEFIPERGYSRNYMDQVELRLKRIERDLGEQAWESIDLGHLSDWLKPLTREVYIKLRGTWIDIYKFACSVGLSERNLAEATLVKKSGEKLRKRWTLETYRPVYAKAEPWLQVAMDFAVTSLQRRIDLVNIHKKRDFDEAGRILVLQQKTGKRIAIKVGGGLEEVIARAKQLHPFCPFVIAHRPDRNRKSPKNPKEHPFQITTDYLTKAIAKVRDESGVFVGWPKEETPTLHELRSFGAHLYEEAGYPIEYIQALLGHADEKMTEHYLSGYGDKWQEVAAELPLSYR